MFRLSSRDVKSQLPTGGAQHRTFPRPSLEHSPGFTGLQANISARSVWQRAAATYLLERSLLAPRQNGSKSRVPPFHICQVTDVQPEPHHGDLYLLSTTFPPPWHSHNMPHCWWMLRARWPSCQNTVFSLFLGSRMFIFKFYSDGRWMLLWIVPVSLKSPVESWPCLWLVAPASSFSKSRQPQLHN